MRSSDEEYYDTEEFREVLEDYENMVASGSTRYMDPDELADIADYYHMNGRYDEADAAIVRALEISPGAIAPLTYRIHEALESGNTALARQWLDSIVDKDEPDYVYDTAEIMLTEGQNDECERYLRQELTKVPSFEYQDYVVDVARIYSDYGMDEKALEWLARAKQEDTPEFQELMGRVLMGVGQYEKCKDVFTKLIDADPFAAKYWNALASAQYLEGDYSGAIQSSEYAIAIDPENYDGLLVKANSLFQLCNYEGALDFYRRYQRLMPDDEGGMLQQGICLINLERLQEAIDIMEKGIKVAPRDSQYLCELYRELAFAYNETGQTEKAMNSLDMTDNLNCDHVQVMIVKGHLLLSAGKKADAMALFSQALKESTTPRQTLLRIIVSIYDNHFANMAYTMFNMYFAMDEDSEEDESLPEGYAYMALCCYDLKKYDEFLGYLKKACEMNPLECKRVMGYIFPENVAPEDYYEYIKGKLGINN